MVPTTAGAPVAADWDLMGQNQGGLGGNVGKNLDDERYSALASR